MTETITLEQFSDEAKKFLDANAERPRRGEVRVGRGLRLGRRARREDARGGAGRGRRGARRGRPKEFDAGFGWITGPEEYGGRALTGGLRAPRTARSSSRLHDPEQRRVRHRARHGGADDPRPRDPRGARGATCARCAAATSSAASSSPSRSPARTSPASRPRPSATATSGSSPARRCGRPARSTPTSARSSPAPTPDKPKHKGLTMFLVDMHAPGVEVRPLRQMTGGATFNEVFFDEVRVPDSHRLGDVDEGWTVALTTLMNERAAIGGGGAGVGTMSITRFVELAHHLGIEPGPADPPGPRRRLHPHCGRAVHEPAGHGEDPRRPAPGPGDVDRQARAHRQHDRGSASCSPRCSARASSPTPASGAPTPGHEFVLGTPGHARRRRHRRGHAQHRRRARPRAPQGAQARRLTRLRRGGRRRACGAW